MKIKNTISAFDKSRENNFDLIRFIAAVAVVFSHSYPVTGSFNDQEPLYEITNGQNTIGGTAVGIFFIISGFLITQSFINSKSLSRYFLSRLLRIFPALACMVLCCVFVIGPLFTTYVMKEYFSSGVSYRYLFNILTYTKYSTLPGVFASNAFPGTVNGSLWSLPYEVLFYISVPALGLFLLKKPLPALALSSAGLILVFSGFLVTGYLGYMTNYFLCGSMFYCFRKNVVLNGWLALLSLVLLFLSNYYNFYNQSFGLLGGYLVLFMAFRMKLRLHHFARYGDFSYGIYIWAFPVQQVLVALNPATTPLRNFLVSMPFIFILAFLSWFMIEKRSLELKARWNKYQAA